MRPVKPILETVTRQFTQFHFTQCHFTSITSLNCCAQNITCFSLNSEFNDNFKK